MSPKSARAFLSICLPDGPDASSPRFLKALDAISRSESLQRDYKEQIAVDNQARQILTMTAVSDQALQPLVEQASTISNTRRFTLRDPAMLAVLIGFLLLIALLAWHFLGRAGVFPEEALAIAAEGAKLRSEQFEMVDQPAGSLEDWFLLKSFERFHVPDNFAQYQVVGARIFKIENQPVAVLAVPENFMFFMVFDPTLFGISMTPTDTWRTAEFDYKYAAAIRESKGMCFMVVIMGKQKDLIPLLTSLP